LQWAVLVDGGDHAAQIGTLDQLVDRQDLQQPLPLERRAAGLIRVLRKDLLEGHLLKGLQHQAH
jgi:hypothetical protein